MALLMQRIRNLLGGVSQRSGEQRGPAQLVEQVNALPLETSGLVKRPPTKHVAKLTATTTGWENAFFYPLNRTADERYQVVIAAGAIHVYDARTGEEQTVSTPDGTDYLTDTDAIGFRAVTVGDTTIITNRGVATEQGTTVAPGATVPMALLYVAQADFSTGFDITLNGKQVVSYVTEDQFDPASRQTISTDAVASDLIALLQTPGTATGFTFILLGSVIAVLTTDGSDFTIDASDGLGGNGLLVVKDTVQDFDTLPDTGLNGMVIEVTGDVSTAQDNYWVEFLAADGATGRGYWQECPKPSSLIAVDPSTMPHQLTLKGQLAVNRNPNMGPPITPATYDYVSGTATPLDWSITYPSFPTLSLTGQSVAAHQDFGCIALLTADADFFAVPYWIENVENVSPSVLVAVQLYVNDTLAQEQSFVGGKLVSSLPENTFQQFGTQLVAQGVHAGDTITFKIHYNTAAGVDPVGGLAQLIFQTPSTYTNGTGNITISPTHTNTGLPTVDADYPVAATFVLTVGTDSVTYEIPDTDHDDPASIATALATLLDAVSGYSASVSTGSTIAWTRTDGAQLASTLGVTYPDGTYYNDGLSLTPAALIGETFENYTTGATAVIEGNTTNTIVMTDGVMTGGSRATILPGDICGVVSSSDDAASWVFSEIPWKTRGAGDIDVVTFPSFMGSPISDVFFYQNRIGMLSGENIFFTSSGDLFNVFRYTATQLEDDDVIDVKSAHAEVTIFDTALLWLERLYVKSDTVWFLVSGDPILTPTTITLGTVGRFISSPDPKPVINGNSAFYTRIKGALTQIFEIAPNANPYTGVVLSIIAQDISAEIPTYLQGAPLALACDPGLDVLVLLTSANERATLYLYSWSDGSDGRTLAAWGRWDYAAGTTIVSLDISDSSLWLLRKQSDGIYLEQLDLSRQPDANEKVAYLDRRNDTLVAVYDGGTDTNTWTLPYAVATDDSEGAVVVCNASDSTVYTSTRTTTTTVAVQGVGDLSAASVYIGQPYTYQVDPGTLYQRGEQDIPETQGRLQVRFAYVWYRATTDLTVTMTPAGRTAVVSTLALAAPDEGVLRIPVLCRNTDASLVFTDDTPGATGIVALDWEALQTLRSQRI